MVRGDGICEEYLQWPGLNMKGNKDVDLSIWGVYPTLWWFFREDDAMSDKCKPKRFTESVAPIWKGGGLTAIFRMSMYMADHWFGVSEWLHKNRPRVLLQVRCSALRG